MKLGSYDLHCHSTCSDGTKTPKELIDMAKEIGLGGLSITDHDTVAAYTKDVTDYAKDKGIDLIPGVEFSTEYKKRDCVEVIHILAYGLDVTNEKLKAFCKLHEERRKERFQKILEKLKAGGYDLSDVEFDMKGSFGRPHIAIALIAKGHAKDMGDAFKRFLGNRSPYYVKTKVPTIEETILVIKIAGGKAILAHPILIKGRKVLRKVISTYSFDGMECYYGNFVRDRVEYLLKMCEERNLIITGGSDYHGEHRTFVSLGSSFLKAEEVRRLISTS